MDENEDKGVNENKLSPLAKILIEKFEEEEAKNHEQKISVNRVVSKVATWYEKLRNAMEYREEEVILRAAIERNLRRHLLLGGNAQTSAEPLVRELIWAGYLKDEEVPESTILKVESSIDLFLQLRLLVLKKHKFPQSALDEWTYQLMSSDIERIVNPMLEREIVANFMYQILKDHIKITDDTEETKNAQVYVGVRKSFARDDIAFLRYHLFKLFFGKVTLENVDSVADDFPQGYKEIEYQLKYPRKDKINSYIKKRAAAFLILEDILAQNKGDDKAMVANEERLTAAVEKACEARYENIATKVRRAIIRSVIFILVTKLIFAILVEGTYERIVYGQILWNSIIINTVAPAILMVIVGLFIRTPGKDNTERVKNMIGAVLFDENPRLGASLSLTKIPDQRPSALRTIFNILWLLAFVVSFGGISFILTKIGFNPISQFIFLFFLTIVSFLSYRINLMANLYTVGDKQGYLTPVVDFLFMPIIRVGRRLTEGISQLNFVLIIFDFVIETPFKLIFAFTERWFRFMHEKRDELG